MLDSEDMGICQPLPENALAVDPLSRSTTSVLEGEETSLAFPAGITWK
jgi:hypothetical protein